MACRITEINSPEFNLLINNIGVDTSLLLYNRYNLAIKKGTFQGDLLNFLEKSYNNRLDLYNKLSNKRITLNNTGNQSGVDIMNMYQKDKSLYIDVSKPILKNGKWEYYILKPINYYTNIIIKDAESRETYLLDNPEYTKFKRTKKTKEDYSNNNYKRIYQKLDNKIKLLEQQLNRTENKSLKEEITSKIESTKEQLQSLKDKESIFNILLLTKNDLDEVSSILESDIISNSDILNTKRILDFWTDNGIIMDLFTNEDIEKGSDRYKLFKELKNRADDYQIKWINIVYDKIRKEVENNTGQSYSDEVWDNISKNFKDINIGQAYFRDLSSVDNIIVQYADKIIKEAGAKTELEAVSINNKIDELYDKIKNKVGKNFSLFKQINGNNKSTGNLVHRFAQNFFDTAKEYKPRDWKNKDQVLKYKKFKKDNMIAFDYRKLFNEIYNTSFSNPIEYTQEEIEAHISDLKQQLGDIGYNYYYNKAEKKFKDFLDRYNAKRDELQEEYNNDIASVETQLSIWENQYSPFNYIKDIYENTKIFNKNKAKFQGYEYVLEVPRKFDINNKSTGFYDNNFETIESDNNLKEFYDFLMDKLEEFKSYYPKDVTDGLQENFLPDLPKSLLENLSNLKGIGPNIFNMMVDSISKENMYNTIIDETGRQIRILPVFMINQKSTSLTDSEKAQLRTLAREKYTEGSKDYNEYYKQLISDKVSERVESKSFDLANLLKALAFTSLTYKHKSQIEDSVKLVNLIVEEAFEAQTNPDGTNRFNKYGSVSTKEGLNNLKLSWQYSMDVFYGQTQGTQLSKKKLYNYAEKQAKKAIASEIKKTEMAFQNNEIDEKEYKETLEKLKNEEDKLGKQLQPSKIIDLVNKYVHIKGLGWNPFSAITNMFQAFVSNFTYSSMNLDFNDKELTWAYGKIFSNNILKGNDIISTPEGRKITNLMKKFNINNDVTEGLYGSKVGSKFDKFGPLKLIFPYELTKRIEFINQGATALAKMKNTKIVNLEGKEKSLYDAFDNDGNWNVEEFGENPDWDITGKNSIKFKTQLESIKKKIHGNYDSNSPTLIKKTALGRSLMLFRSWIAEGIASRFEAESYDAVLERNIKGRYRSYIDSKDIFGERLGYKKVLKGIILELGRQLTFNQTLKNSLDEFSDIDQANLKRNTRELILYSTLISIGLILSYAKAEDDENDTEAYKYFLNYSLNAINRAQTDVSFYVNPVSFEKLMRTTIPIIGTFDDIYAFNRAGRRYLEGRDGDNGAVTLEQRTWQLFPGGSIYYSTKGLLNKEY